MSLSALTILETVCNGGKERGQLQGAFHAVLEVKKPVLTGVDKSDDGLGDEVAWCSFASEDLNSLCNFSNQSLTSASLGVETVFRKGGTRQSRSNVSETYRNNLSSVLWAHLLEGQVSMNASKGVHELSEVKQRRTPRQRAQGADVFSIVLRRVQFMQREALTSCTREFSCLGLRRGHWG